MVSCIADLNTPVTAEFVFGLVANTFGVTTLGLVERLRSSRPSIYPNIEKSWPVIGERVYRRSVRMLFAVLPHLHPGSMRALKPSLRDGLVLLKLLVERFYGMPDCDDILVQYLNAFIPFLGGQPEYRTLEGLSVELLSAPGQEAEVAPWREIVRTEDVERLLKLAMMDRYGYQLHLPAAAMTLDFLPSLDSRHIASLEKLPATFCQCLRYHVSRCNDQEKPYNLYTYLASAYVRTERHARRYAEETPITDRTATGNLRICSAVARLTRKGFRAPRELILALDKSAELGLYEEMDYQEFYEWQKDGMVLEMRSPNNFLCALRNLYEIGAEPEPPAPRSRASSLVSVARPTSSLEYLMPSRQWTSLSESRQESITHHAPPPSTSSAIVVPVIIVSNADAISDDDITVTPPISGSDSAYTEQAEPEAKTLEAVAEPAKHRPELERGSSIESMDSVASSAPLLGRADP
ncbi:hypothetical protein PUNSTDRAFT_44182 [Punctularia strigosozonata HHB-11173 SS5]|uniref:uncharacterized protein n=1 Tax=Punctularia strigosozonata (strain HHB-11173) TaxID=741275 RepID=UPI0004416310|nr:uncharacterized protein PUNSTDRAFT_44182 [Punctularia strigosozonata HHB-11173 SS5]EIN09985.1 hypothetical protein PUNSTDRAFT_44182 [Punctularia strigosozonata HHB-11173 SS5]